MRKNIRPADEEIGNFIPLILFSILWYGIVLGSIAETGFSMFMLVFLVGGMLPLFTMVNSVRRALFYRKQRADAIAFGNVSSGRITGVTRQDVPYTVGEHNRIRYQRYYFLQVEVTDPVTGVSHQLESQGYRKPVHRYLSSDCVKVYTDQSGWKHYIEGFQWKEHKSDPDIFPTPKEYEEMHFGSGVVFQIIFVVILLLMIYNVFGRFM